MVQKTYGDKYKLTRCVGVGTVAESYFAKDASGKEVCIKMLKNGISADKIEKDKTAFIEMVKVATDKTQEEKDFLIKNIESIAEGVKAEVDFTNELNAAKALKQVTHQAKVVVPMEVKNGLYIMEKADGVSLQKLMEYLEIDKLQEDVNRYAKLCGEANNDFDKRLYNSLLNQTKSKLADMQQTVKGCENIGEISKDEAKQLLEKYQDVLIEQFSKIDEKGKIIHGDIHPGNIFVDIPAMRKGDKNFFTLIDTGNTIQQNSETALRFLNLSSYIKNADVDNIASFVVEGAKLPSGMTKEKALEEVSKELKNAFFDSKTKLGTVTNDNILGITDSIMQKLNIIPADTQGNLMKAKTSANQSLQEFQKTFYEALVKQAEKKLEGKDGVESAAATAAEITKMGTEVLDLTLKNKTKTMIQERQNLLKMSPKSRIAIKKSANTPKHNSEDYLTYILKQYK